MLILQHIASKTNTSATMNVNIAPKPIPLIAEFVVVTFLTKLF